MAEILSTLKEFWYLLLAVGTAIGGAIKWWISYKSAKKAAAAKVIADKAAAKKAESSSTAMLYAQLEEMKKTLILSVQKDMERATSEAELKHIIATFKIHCPDCYVTVISKIYPDGSAEENI